MAKAREEEEAREAQGGSRPPRERPRPIEGGDQPEGDDDGPAERPRRERDRGERDWEPAR